MARKRKVVVNEMPPTPERCPHCGSEELVLHGSLPDAYTQPLSNGKPIGSPVTVNKTEILWNRISCVRCGAFCDRTDQRVIELQEELELLQYQLAYITGKLVPENRLPC